MKLNIRAVDVVVVAIIAILGFYVFINIESYEEEIFVGEGDEAKRQNFLALKKHLANSDTEVIFASDHSQLFSSKGLSPIRPSVSDVIILTESEMIISQALANDILTWVNEGGHIIIGLVSENFTSTFSTNYLLKELGVQTKVLDATEFNDTQVNENDETGTSSNVPSVINTENYGEIEVNVDDGISIMLVKSETVVFSAGLPLDRKVLQPTMIQMSIGKGLVTLMTDVFVWNNDQIIDNDNVLLIHQLLENDSKVFVFERSETLMWHKLIAKYSPSFYWILLFFTVLCAWFVGIRFGAIRQVNNTVVTYFSQHIHGAGQFYWNNNQREKLLRASREQLIDDVSTKFAKSNPSEEQVAEVLTKLSNWPKDKIHFYVFGPDKKDSKESGGKNSPINSTINNAISESQFTQLIQGLQQLRKMI